MNQPTEQPAAPTATLTSAKRCWQCWVAVILLSAITLGTFSRVFRASFLTYDDQSAIYQNPTLNPPTLKSLKIWWTQGELRLWNPVIDMVRGALALRQSGPLDPMTGSHISATLFHTTNVVFHLISVLMVYQVLRLLSLGSWAALAGAALFAIHPVQVEPVAWAMAMKDTLCAVLSMPAIWFFLRANGFSTTSTPPFDAPEQPVDPKRFAISTVFFVLAMLAKPAAVVLPLVVLGLSLLRWSKPPVSIWKQVGFWLVLTLPILIVTRIVQPPLHLVHIAPWLRPLVAGDAISFYLCKLVWPGTLTIDYGRRPELLLQNGQIYWTWLLAASVIALLFFLRHRARPLFVAGWIFIAAMLPVIGLTEFDFERYTTVADRYLYLPMLGAALALAYAAQKLGRAVVIPIVLVLLALAGKSFVQTGYWKDSVTLFRHGIDCNPNSVICLGGLAQYNIALGHNDTARSLLKQCIAARPDLSESHVNLAALEFNSDHRVAAAEEYVAAFKLLPGTIWTEIDKDYAKFRDSKNYDAAVFYAGLETQLLPERAQAWTRLGYCLCKLGDFSNALPALAKAEQLSPPNVQTEMLLGEALARSRRYAEAEQHLYDAITLDPGNQQALHDLQFVQNHMGAQHADRPATQP